MSYEQGRRDQDLGDDVVQRRAAPGKVSRSEKLAPVQRQEDESEASEEESSEDGVQEIAAAGVAGAGERLPFLDVIQQSFGRHDVSGISAHTGAEASEASAAIGASAYATGSSVAFGGTPDLHTAAHEATHVVQQRAGVSLKGGVGQAGDPYEQHADAVADRVVRGESAEVLLDGMSGGGGGGAVQLKETPQHLAEAKGKARVDLEKLIIDPVVGSTLTRLGDDMAGQIKATLLDDVHDAAVAAVEADIDGSGADAKKKADTKAQAENIAAGPVSALIKDQGLEVAEGLLNGLKAQLGAAANLAIDGAKAGRFFDTKPEELRGKAKTAAVAKAAEKQAERLAAGKAKIAKPEFLDALKVAARAGVHDKSAAELVSRDAADGDLIATIKPPVEAAVGTVHGAMQTYLEDQIGAKGTKFFGHKKANEFRQKMKDAAREQAYQDVEGSTAPGTAFDNDRTRTRLDGAGAATKQYFVMQGKANAYDDAKGTVDEYLARIATEGANELVATGNVESKITDVARSAAWGELRGGGATAKKKAVKEATTAANAAAVEQKTALAGAAKSWQEKLIAGQEVSRRDEDGDAHVIADASAEVKQEVHDGAIGSTALQHAIEAETIGDGVSKLGTLLDLAVPNSGEALKLACEIKIPVPSAPGVFCVVKIEGSAERHSGNKGKDLELGVNVEFGAGFEAMGLSADARINLFLKARGPDTDKACKMMSYGVYRDLCGNPFVPQAVATWWATGKAARTGEVSKDEEAETWAAMVEEYAMTGEGGDDAFVESGWGGAAQGKANAGLVSAQAKIALSTARHWDKKSLARAGYTPGQLAHGGDVDANKAAALEKRKKVNELGTERRTQANIEGQIEAEADGQKFALGVKFQRVGGNPDNPKLGLWDVEVLGQIPYDASSEASATQLSKFAGQYVPSALAALRSFYERVKNRDDKDGGTKAAGTVIEDTSELLQGLDAGGLTGNIGKQLSDIKMVGAQPEYMNDGLAGALGTRPSTPVDPLVSRHSAKSILQVSIYRKEANWGFAISEIKQLSIGLGDRAGVGASASLTAEKTKKLFSAGEDGVNNW